MINGNIELNYAYLGQLSFFVVNSHWNIIEFDGSIVIADTDSRFNATLICPGQAQGSEQNRVVDRTAQAIFIFPNLPGSVRPGRR